MERYHVGLSSAPKPKEFAEAISALINSADLNQYARGAIEVVKKEYNWYNITENLVSVSKKLTI